MSKTQGRKSKCDEALHRFSTSLSWRRYLTHSHRTLPRLEIRQDRQSWLGCCWGGEPVAPITWTLSGPSCLPPSRRGRTRSDLPAVSLSNRKKGPVKAGRLRPAMKTAMSQRNPTNPCHLSSVYQAIAASAIMFSQI